MNSTPDEADDLLKSIPSLYSVKKSSEGKKNMEPTQRMILVFEIINFP